MTEALEANREKWCDDHAVEHHSFPLKHGQNGWPDKQYFWGRGLHFWVEFKKNRKSPYQHYQKIIHRMLRNFGDKVYVVESNAHFCRIIEWWEQKHGPATAIRPP